MKNSTAGAQSAASGDARAQPSERGFGNAVNPVPDWCNIGITLRVLVGVNAVMFAIAALRSNGWAQFIQSAVELAATAEPVLLTSLLLGCLLRRATAGWPAFAQIALALLLPAVLTYGWLYFLQTGFDFPSPRVARYAVSAALLSAGVLYWARLRTLAYSPALAQARLQALQSRIRPHFLFNSLNAVLGLIRSDPRRAETAIEDLADLFRVLMRDSRERVPLRDEVALCKQYLAIETLRLGDRLHADWRVDEGVMGALVPTLLLQPLIENAVLHGIEPTPGGGTIAIRIAGNGAYVDITISNPVSGGAAQPGGAHSGIGLDNVRQRLALVHDLEARLETSARDGRFEVKIQLPIETAMRSGDSAISRTQGGFIGSRESAPLSAAVHIGEGKDGPAKSAGAVDDGG